MGREKIRLEELEFHPLTPERWPDLEDLFGEHGASSGCWCMWPRLPPQEYRRLRGEGNKRLFRALVESGEKPGILAYHRGRAVGWCALGPREKFVHLSCPTFPYRKALAPVDEEPVWSVVCFYVRPAYRRRGLTLPLLQAAVAFAAEQGARVLEGYPWDRGPGGPPTYMGPLSTFLKAGFVEVARRHPQRPILRYYVR
ncbi:MAG: GNAT family N-acetyltransferase [Candidatus Bipolaricaulota bacterium]|nr:GNAT family N-acetyltransferase [Candidatus Bipolaricaulota bacterium]MDW8152440.1 GNAT family N-acetyltransferase [Candidatus Bipolaricaulota bacterium]